MNKEQEQKEKEHLRQSILGNVLCLYEKIHYDKFGHDTKETQILSREKIFAAYDGKYEKK